MDEAEEAGARVAFHRRKTASTEPWHKQVSLEINLIFALISASG